MSQKVWLVMRAFPWEKLNVKTGEKDDEGNDKQVSAGGNHYMAGFIPVYWDEPAAREAHPDAQIQEGTVGDAWAKRPAAPSVAPGMGPGPLELDVPQGDQGPKPWDFSDLDKDALVAKVTEFEEALTERGMENFIVTVKQFVLKGKKPGKRTSKEDLLSYASALYKIMELRKEE